MTNLKVVYFILTYSLSCVLCQFNMTAYMMMPPLFNIDDYDACFDEQVNNNGGSRYCVVYGEIVPNDSVVLWKQIDKFSSDRKRNFRHDILYFGVCLHRCKEIWHRLTRFQKNQLYGGKVKNTVMVSYYADVNKRDSDERVRYDRLISSCLNYDFRRKYGLALRTSIEYCVASDNLLKFDKLDISFFAFFIIIILLTIFSSLYDFRLKRKQPSNMQSNEFYTMFIECKKDSLLSSFSLCRNYFRLVLPSKRTDASRLEFFGALRFFTILLVIFAHVLMLTHSVQIQNPEFFEKALNRTEINIILNGSAVIQVFFVMSGFLLCVNFKQQMVLILRSTSNSMLGLRSFMRLVLFRFMRLTPSYAFAIFFNATMLTHLQDGPLWRHITEAERTFCRETWWKNLLYVNNLLLERSCIHQSWYLAADFQLFILMSAVTVTVTRYPKTRQIIFSMLAIVSFTTPALLTYFFKLDAIHHESPESYRYLFWNNSPTFYKVYVPFYTNIGGYLIGVIAGNIYLEAKHRMNVDNLKGSLKYNLIWFLVFPAAFALLFSGGVFYFNDFTKPSIWAALYAGFYRILWCFLCGVVILGMCFKMGWVAYEFSSMALFRPLGRITYQAFLLHTIIARIILGQLRQPVYVNVLTITSYFVLCSCFTLMAAFFLSLLIEYPIGVIIKTLTTSKNYMNNSTTESVNRRNSFYLTNNKINK